MTVQRRCFNADQTHPAHLWQTDTGEVFYCDPLVTAQQGEGAVFEAAWHGVVAHQSVFFRGDTSEYAMARSIAKQLWLARAQRSEARQCGLCFENTLIRNPHEDAGKPEHILKVGAEWACPPCQQKALHRATEALQRSEAQVRALENADALAGEADSQDGER